MKGHELIAMGLAFVGGFGGLLSYLAWLTILETLSSSRPTDDQIPLMVASWKELECHSDFVAKHGSFYHWKFARQFHEFPDSPAYFWFLGGIIWAGCFLLSAAIIGMRH